MIVIGMKILGAGHYIAPHLGVSAAHLLRFALDQGITVAIAGCASPSEVGMLASVGKVHKPLPSRESKQLTALFAPQAKQLGFYRKGWHQ